MRKRVELKSPVRENRTPGSVRGPLGNWRSYRDGGGNGGAASSQSARQLFLRNGMSDAINGDLSVRAVVDTARMEWVSSPSGSVWRKRVHLVGPPESGQVTSVVRYEPKSRFPAHDHPEGEEILVLDGVFSDEHGDWPAGTYLLNPEGFRHAPSSEPGCLLFVKLRQFPGRERRHVVVDTHGTRTKRALTL